MSNWQKIKQKAGWLSLIEQTCYTSPEFPLEVRDILADWFALHDVQGSFLSFDGTDLAYQQYICGFIIQMIEQLEERTSALQTAQSPHLEIYQFRMTKLTQQIKDFAKRDPLALFKSIQESLLAEAWQFNKLSQLESRERTTSSCNPVTPKTFPEISRQIMENIHDARMSANDTANNIGVTASAYSALAERYNKKQISEQQVCEEIARLRGEVGKMRIDVKGVIGQLEILFQRITQELDLFKDEQRFVSLGRTPTRNLQTIDKWFEGVSNCVEILRQTLVNFTTNLCAVLRPDLQSDIQADSMQIENLHKQMVLSSLAIETEPSQIVRKDSKSGSIMLRVLTCSSSMMILNQSQKPTAILIDRKGLDEFTKSGDPECIPNETASASLEFAAGYPCVKKNQVEFKDLKIKLKSRGKKKLGDDSVVEEKFCILFKVFVHVSGRTVQLWTLSLPLTITAHPNQDDDAWSAILWHNAFPTSNRQSLQVPDEVEWSSIVEMINLRFLVLGKELTEGNKNHLKEKVFRGMVPQNEMLTRKMFCKDPFLERKIFNPSSGDSKPEDVKKTWLSFWDWLWCCLKLLAWVPPHVSQSLRKLWREDRIVGFMSEAEIKHVLAAATQVKPGTFIIRFPERKADCIGLYWYNPSESANGEVLYKFAYNIDDLTKVSLQDRIHQNPLLTHVYPGDVDKSLIKGSNSSGRRMVDGYIIPGIIQYIPRSFLQLHHEKLAIQSPPSMMDSTSPAEVSAATSHHSHSTGDPHTDHYCATSDNFPYAETTLEELLKSLPFEEPMEGIQNWKTDRIDDTLTFY